MKLQFKRDILKIYPPGNRANGCRDWQARLWSLKALILKMLRLFKSVLKAQNQNKLQKTIQKTIILFRNSFHQTKI